MDQKLTFDLNTLPKGGWLRLEEAMQFVLSEGKGEWDESVAAFQLALHEAARDGALVLHGIPKQFDEDEFEEDPAARQTIPSTYFMLSAVCGFDYEDGSILPFSFEADCEDSYNRLVRRRTQPMAGTADEWRFVIVERKAFVVFLRDRLGAATTEGMEIAHRVVLPRVSEAELLDMVRRANDWLGGTAGHPVDVPRLLTAINHALKGRRAHLTRKTLRPAHEKAFPGRSGSGRLPKDETTARELRHQNCARKSSLAELLFSTLQDARK
ncbi:hypothetical protein [Xanthobacter sp.]|uniref:hypothetical protein n=1 Tax=Xanthobacter sp. TaxID=35809 RepID=UPI0035B19DDC